MDDLNEISDVELSAMADALKEEFVQQMNENSKKKFILTKRNRNEALWTKAAVDCIVHEAPASRWIQAAIAGNTVPGGPFVNMLHGPSAARKYLEFCQSMDIDLSEEASEAPMAKHVEMMLYVYKIRITRFCGGEYSLESALRYFTASVGTGYIEPWVAVAICPQDPVLEKYFDLAMEKLNKNPELKKTLKYFKFTIFENGWRTAVL